MSRYGADPQATNVQELTAAIFQRKSLLAAIDPALGKYLTVSVAYRGKMSMRDIENGVWEFQNRNSAYFVPWVSEMTGVWSRETDLADPELCPHDPMYRPARRLAGIRHACRQHDRHRRGIQAISCAVPCLVQTQSIPPLVHWRRNGRDGVPRGRGEPCRRVQRVRAV